jgi:predicted RNA-binding protein (virulence factor B family)
VEEGNIEKNISKRRYRKEDIGKKISERRYRKEDIEKKISEREILTSMLGITGDTRFKDKKGPDHSFINFTLSKKCPHTS